MCMIVYCGFCFIIPRVSYCFPLWLLCTSFPLIVAKDSTFFIALLTFFSRFFFINTTLWYKVIVHTNFSFFLSVEHLFIKPHDHFYILFGGIFVQVLCSFFLHFFALCY